MRKLTVALVQLESRPLDVIYNLDLAETEIRRAAASGANLVCLPELFASGYDLPLLANRLEELAAESTCDSVLSRLCSLAQSLQVYIAAGVIRKSETKACENSAVFINDDGTVQGFYTKNHLFGNEKNYFSLGDGYPVFHTRYGTVGLLICYDNNFPEPARILTLMGAELILVLCAWRVEDKAIFELMAAAHACENTVFLGACNMYYNGDSLKLFGGSRIVDPCGRILAESTISGTDLVLSTLDLDELSAERAQRPVLRDRHPADENLGTTAQ